MKNQLLIFIPTYNERDNVVGILRQILELKLSADILFIDDNSPDGTGKILDELALKHPNVRVIHRAGKLGIGTAHKEAIAWAYDKGYTQLVTMDCDFTHSPEYIPKFIELGESADIVVGSRYLQKGSLSTWNLKRRLLTHSGYAATSLLLNMPYDATGSFRLYRLDKISKQFISLIKSTGYSFFFESLFILNQNKLRISQIATNLPARTYGNSKMRISDAINSLKQLGSLFVARTINPNQFLMVDEPMIHSNLTRIVDPQNWDDYWERNSKKQSYFLYDLAAVFYRKFIIRPALNKWIRSSFPPGVKVMHAGCGSGQVDADVAQYVNIAALDISAAALRFYHRVNPGVKELIHASIFNIPLENESLDGIYNLGVMEHFTSSEIELMLKEFSRVLKGEGKIVLFWPPKNGLTVRFLGVIHYLLNDVFKKNIRLHPEEITHITSKEHATKLLRNGGFELENYSFGIGDLYTHAILVGKKSKNA